MKYGVLYFKYSEFVPYLRDRKPYYNIGDNIQSFAVEQLYQSMGIPPEQILYISDDELETYCGEYVIICLNIYGGLKPSLKFSDHIIPVFMGYNCPYYLDDDTRKVLMKHQPIGCRDEIT
ncbi:MAG: hypothetical protein VB071_15655, partial [Lawsonibacter sp.]|nr:hypothetical protein [Lawsonibacter sp.]